MGFSQTFLGNNGLRIVLVSANTPPPSKKSLQKTSNILMVTVDKFNEADMSHMLPAGGHKRPNWQ